MIKEKKSRRGTGKSRRKGEKNEWMMKEIN